MRRSKCLLISAIIGSLYFCYLAIYFSGGMTASSNVWEALGAGIAAQIVMPHIMAVAVAVTFNWIAWAKNAQWAAITSCVLYGMSALVFILYGVFVLPEMALSFAGIFMIRNIKIDLDENINAFEINFKKANFCAYCGKRREFTEKFTEYGFCEECNKAARKEIKGKLEAIQHGVTIYNPDGHQAMAVEEALGKVEELLATIEKLEQLREVAPFFKSSTEECKDKLLQYQEAYHISSTKE